MKKSKKEYVVKVVLEHYLSEHTSITAKEIAAKLHVSASTVSRWFSDGIKGVSQTLDYGEHQFGGGSRFWIYYPTQTLLREEILKLRQKNTELSKLGEGR